jgi:CRISPR/Cas system-associated endoribonuclease Cas2
MLLHLQKSTFSGSVSARQGLKLKGVNKYDDEEEANEEEDEKALNRRTQGE